MDLKLRELDSLPVGISVTHSPNPVAARKGGRSGSRYTWLYGTTVCAIENPIRIQEFGAFGWNNGEWRFWNFTGRPFTAHDFSEWYSCRNATLMPGEQYTDPSNWSGSDVLRQAKTLWYFIGITPGGKKVKGQAVITELAELE